MITGISIENFKGVRERLDLEFAPITMLFGANSTGKSTISDALSYLHAILESRSAVPDKYAPLGKFEFGHLVHGHDPAREIVLGITCDLSDDDYGYFSTRGHDNDEMLDELGHPTSFEPGFLLSLESLSLQLTICSQWTHIAGGLVGSAQVREVIVRFNGNPLATISACITTGPGLQTFRWRVSLKNDLLNDQGTESSIEFTSLHRTIFPLEWDPPLSAGFYKAEEDNDVQPSAKIANDLNSLVTGAFNICLNRLRQKKVIGGIRLVPGPGFQPLPTNDPARWLDGRAAWDFLAYCGEDALIDVNSWLVRIGASYVAVPQFLVDIRKVLPLIGLKNDDYRLPVSLTNLRNNSHRQIRIASAESEDEAAEILVNPSLVRTLLWPADVGSGVAQVIPIVVICRQDSAAFTCVHQPELHLHPSIQASMGDLFIDSTATYKHRFLIETHSEYLLLRLMRRIRETASGAGNAEPRLTCDDVAIYHVFRAEGQTRVKRLELDDHGSLASEWPDSLLEIGFWEKFGE